MNNKPPRRRVWIAIATLLIVPASLATAGASDSGLDAASQKCNPIHALIGCVHLSWSSLTNECWWNPNGEWRCDAYITITATGWSDAYVPGMLNSHVGGCTWPHTLLRDMNEVIDGARGCQVTGTKSYTAMFSNGNCYTYTDYEFGASVQPGNVKITVKFDYRICYGQPGYALNWRVE